MRAKHRLATLMGAIMRAAQNGAGVLSTRGGIPLTIVAGETGAGKSTLLAHVTVAPAASRVATVTSAATDVTTSLSRLSEGSERPDHVFLEVATFTEIRRARGYAYMPGFRVCGMVMVMSAETVSLCRRDALPDELGDASVVIMNRLDTLSDEDAIRAEHWLARCVAPKPLLCTRNGDVAPALLLGVDPSSTSGDVSMISVQWSADLEIPPPDRGRRRRVAAPRGDSCRVWNLDCPQPVDSLTFRRWIERLPPSIVRGHGVVMTKAEPHVRYRFERFGAHWGFERDALLRDDELRSRVVLVGL